MNTTTTDIDAVALLGEPQRHALYRWVSQQPSPVSRDAAAAAGGWNDHGLRVRKIAKREPRPPGSGEPAGPTIYTIGPER